MHLEQIRDRYPKELVEVAFVISRAGAYTRKNRFPRFHEDFKASYTALDDSTSRVVMLYGLNPRTSVAKNLVFDGTGKLRLVTEFATSTVMAKTVDKLLGEGALPDLSTPQKVREVLASPDLYLRWRAVKVLCERKGKETVEPLIAALYDSSASIRESAAMALGARRDVRAVSPLLTTLKDPSRPVQLAAIAALGELKVERAVTPLVKRLLDSGFRAQAAEALVKIERPEAVKKAMAGMSAASLPMRDRADLALLMGRIYARGKSYDAAAASYQDAVDYSQRSDLDADWHDRLLEEMGDLHRDKGEMVKALFYYNAITRNRNLRRQIDDGGAPAVAYNNLAWFYVQKNVRPKECLTLAKQAIGRAPRDLNTLDTVAWAYLRNGMFDESIGTFADVLKRDPTFESSWEGLGVLIRSAAPEAKLASLLKYMEGRAARDPRIELRLRKAQELFAKHRKKQQDG